MELLKKKTNSKLQKMTTKEYNELTTELLVRIEKMTEEALNGERIKI